MCRTNASPLKLTIIKITNNIDGQLDILVKRLTKLMLYGSFFPLPLNLIYLLRFLDRKGKKKKKKNRNESNLLQRKSG